jgi:hypothetical protein
MTFQQHLLRSLLGLAMGLPPSAWPSPQASRSGGWQPRPEEGTGPAIGVLPLPPDSRLKAPEADQGDTLLAFDGQRILDELEELERFRTRFPGFYARYAGDPAFRTHLTAERSLIQADLAAGGSRGHDRKLKAELRRVEADLRLLARIRHLEGFKDQFRNQLSNRLTY